jgi:hypothetical protein
MASRIYADHCVSIAFIRFQNPSTFERFEKRKINKTKCCVRMACLCAFHRKRKLGALSDRNIVHILLNIAQVFSVLNGVFLMMV